MPRRGRDDEATNAPLLSKAKDALKHFGHSEFRDGQEDVILSLLREESTLFCASTGQGKSLCYQLPAVVIAATAPTELTVCISPLISLMKDQMQGLKEKGIPLEVDALGSFLGAEERANSMRRIRGGVTQLLFISPEQIVNETTRSLILSRKVAMLVVDEAHCISEMGFSFRPDYLRVANFAKVCSAQRVLALTATATPIVASDILQGFSIEKKNHYFTKFYRANLHLNYHVVGGNLPRNQLVTQLLRQEPQGPTIIYTTTQKDTEDLAAFINASPGALPRGVTAKSFHAGMSPQVRSELQDSFMSSSQGVVVATIAFGMGVDKSNIRKIIHAKLSKSLEGYAQEIGRAGRDGKVSKCDLILCKDDIQVLEAFSLCDGLSADNVYGFVQELLVDPATGRQYPAGTVREVAYYELAKRHDMSELSCKMLATWLELYGGVLEQSTPKYRDYKLKMALGAADLRAKLAGLTNQAAAAAIGRAMDTKATWAYLDADVAATFIPAAAAVAFKSPRDQIVSSLNELQSRGTEVVASRMVQCLRVKQNVAASTGAGLVQLALNEYNRFRQREKRDLTRIADVINLACSSDCQSMQLARFFGEEIAAGRRCGTCTACRSSTGPLEAPARAGDGRADTPIPEADWQRVVHVANQPGYGVLKTSPRLLARFALGSKSPRLSQTAGLLAHEHFGVLLGKVNFEAVLARCEAFTGKKDDKVE